MNRELKELSRTCSIGKLIKFYLIPRQRLLPPMAGRALRGMLSTADYKGGKALKSCHTEFVHIYGAAFIYIKGHPQKGWSFCVNPFFFALMRIRDMGSPLAHSFVSL